MTTSDPHRLTGRAQIQRGAAGMGALSLLIGILGFVPGVTRPYADLRFASMSSTAEILGLFQVSVLVNLVHLGFGIAGLVMARTPLRARNYLLGGGVIYLVLFLYGVVARRSVANVLPVNSADNFLHLVLGGAMIAMAIWLDRGPDWRRIVEEKAAQV